MFDALRIALYVYTTRSRVAVYCTTHGRSGCKRAFREKISVIAPLKSHQLRSAVGSGKDDRGVGVRIGIEPTADNGDDPSVRRRIES